MLPELARAVGVRLEQANSWFEALQSLAWLLGPPLAGLLIAWIGVTNVLWLDAASFGISALLVGMLVPALLVVTPPTSHGRYRDELVAGLHFLWNDRLLRALAVGLALTNAMFNPLFAVVLPVYTRATTGSATDLGLLLTAEGLGALIGALLFGVIGHRLPRRATWIGAFLINALPFWMLVFAPSLPVLMGALFIAGVMGGPLNPLLVTIRHERVPLALRGRVFGTFSAISMAATPLGIVLAGYLIEATSWHATVLALAVCYQAVGIGMLFVRAFHDMKRRDTEAA
jgi:predicted MFS family arabinose efflux permease